MSERTLISPRIGDDTEELIHASKLLSLQVEGVVKGYVEFYSLPVADSLERAAGILKGLAMKARKITDMSNGIDWDDGCGGCPHEHKCPCPLQFSDEPCPPHGKELRREKP
ncbi:MAG: hypothetical protein IAE94_05255 [Chthoniobacterales bacterium]|nr:hypothetical protein [Chthoniobacterales bacterium]